MPEIRVFPAVLKNLKEIEAYIENDLANPIAEVISCFYMVEEIILKLFLIIFEDDG